uniref:cAMP-dependent protein kinase type II regulatory subunit n=1 Tax=Triatoma infestans TaxID=30076 RepID=A0A161M7N7_TRIIF
MQRQHIGKIAVSNEFRQMMLEFTVTYLLEQPQDPVAFAAEYFQRLRSAERDIEDAQHLESPSDSALEEDIQPPQGHLRQRRKSISAEAYNPEEDDGAAPEYYPKTDKERQILRNACQNIFIFRSLDQDQWDEVINATFSKEVEKGEEIIREGDDGDNFYVIESGVYNVFKNVDGEEKKIYTYYHAGSFGELALLYNQPRAATVKAVTDGKLWAMSRQTFRRIVLQRAFKKRKMYEGLIANVPMLESLKPYERLNLADALAPKTFTDGEIIIKQGDIADGMYFIESGEVQVTILNEEEEEIEIKRLHTGDYFGELALVTHKPRAASVYAVGDVKTAYLDVDAFERLLGPCMQIMQRNISTYEQQLIQIFGSKRQISDVR